MAVSYTVRLGSFNKRMNSTKRPTLAEYSQWDEYTVFLKEVTSYDHPTLLLSAEFATVANNHYNYAIMFGRWYWVTDLRAVRTNQIEVDMALDILATFQTEIKGTKAFIEYGLNTFNAGDSATRISDSRRPVAKNPTIYSASVDPSGGIISPNTGCYIVQAVGKDSGVSTYALSAAQLKSLITQINVDAAQDVQDALDLSGYVDGSDVNTDLQALDLKRQLLNESAFQAIKSIHWLPLDISGSSGANDYMYLGYYQAFAAVPRLTQNSIYSATTSINIPWPATDWRRNNVQMSLYIPFFGTVPVPVDQCINTGALTIVWTAEYFSGSVSVKVNAGNYTVYAASTNIAVPFAFGSSNIGISQVLGGGIQAIGGAMQFGAGIIDAGAGLVASSLGLGEFMGGGLVSGISGMAGGAQNMLSGYAQTVQPIITSAGSMGGMAAIGQSMNATLALIYYPALTDTDFESLYGHPVFKVDTPANGFCKTRGFSISLANEATYSAYINAVMDGGCFIED